MQDSTNCSIGFCVSQWPGTGEIKGTIALIGKSMEILTVWQLKHRNKADETN